MCTNCDSAVNLWLVANSSILSARLTTFLEVLALGTQARKRARDRTRSRTIQLFPPGERVQFSPSYPESSSLRAPSRSAESSICCNCIIIVSCKSYPSTTIDFFEDLSVSFWLGQSLRKMAETDTGYFSGTHGETSQFWSQRKKNQLNLRLPYILFIYDASI